MADKPITDGELSRLKVKIDALERSERIFANRLKNASGVFKKKVAKELGEIRKKLSERKEEHRQKKIKLDERKGRDKEQKLKDEKDAWTIKEKASRAKVPDDKKDPVADEEDGTINITKSGKYEIYKKGSGWELLHGKYKGENFDNGTQMTVGFLGSQKDRVEDSKEFGKDEALEYHKNLKGPTQTTTPGSDEVEGTYSFQNGKLYKDDKLFHGQYKGNMYDNGHPMTAITGATQMGPSEEFGKDKALDPYGNIPGPTQSSTPGSEEEKGTYSFQNGMLYKDDQLFHGSYKGNNYDNGRPLTALSGAKQLGNTEGFGKDEGLHGELGPDDAVDYEGNLLQKGEVSEDGTKFVGEGGKWKSRNTGDPRDNEQDGTFNITAGGILEQEFAGESVPYNGTYQGKEYIDGVAADGLKRVDPSEEFGQEENVRIEERNKVLDAEIDQLVAKTESIFTGFDTAMNAEEVHTVNQEAINLIAQIRQKEGA